MQLFEGSYFSVASGWRHLRPNSAIVNGPTLTIANHWDMVSADIPLLEYLLSIYAQTRVS